MIKIRLPPWQTVFNEKIIRDFFLKNNPPTEAPGTLMISMPEIPSLKVDPVRFPATRLRIHFWHSSRALPHDHDFVTGEDNDSKRIRILGSWEKECAAELAVRGESYHR